MKYRVGILDDDVSYSLSLMEYINAHMKDSLEAISFSRGELLDEYLLTDELDVLLTTSEVRSQKKINRIMLLSEERQVNTVATPNEEGCINSKDETIYKYQGARRICERIIKNIGEITRTEADGAFCICVCSPLGRSGTTGYARSLWRKYENSLYIGLEQYPAVDLSTKSMDYIRAISEKFIYYLATHNEGMKDLLETAGRSGGGYELVMAVPYQDLGAIKEADYRWFKEIVKQSDKYSRVIADIGYIGNGDVLKAFDRSYITTLSDEISTLKLSVFREMNAGCTDENDTGIVYVNTSEHGAGNPRIDEFRELKRS